MLLAVDIGNTTISFGVMRGMNVLAAGNFKTDLPAAVLRPQVSRYIKKVSRKYPALLDAAVCSVVPSALKIVRAVLKKHLQGKISVIGKDINVPIVNRYRNPGQVGQDRLVCAYAAQILYGRPLIVVDFGTATTFDVVSLQGAYEGGIIVPGLRLSAEALFQKTALLPRIEIVKIPRHLIGKDTRESILSGLFHGYGALCSGLIDKIAGGFRVRPKVVVTGGYTRSMRKFIDDKIDRIDNRLVFKGIQLVSRNSFVTKKIS